MPPDAQVQHAPVGSQCRDDDAARDEELGVLSSVVAGTGGQPQGRAGAVASGIPRTLGGQVADAVAPDGLLGDPTRRQPVQGSGLFPNPFFRLGQQLGRVGAPHVRRLRPFARSPCRSGVNTARLRRSPTAAMSGAAALDAEFRQRGLEVESVDFHEVRDGVAAGSALAARPDARDAVGGTGFAQALGAIRPDYETVGLARLPSAQRTWAVPAVALAFYSRAKTGLIEFEKLHLPTPARLYFLLSTYFIDVFMNMGRWADM